MHRLTVALLAAFDAVVAATAGLAAIAAPLTVLWALSLGATHWEGLWPTTASIWQLGHHVPQTITLPPDLLLDTGISPDAASFVISLAPLAFFAFTVWVGARSGVRAARAGAWLSGVISGTIVFGAIATAVELTSSNVIAISDPLPAIFMPALAYAVPLLIGAVIGAWIEGDGGVIDALHDYVDNLNVQWAEVPALAVRGVGAVLVGLLGISALSVLASVITRGGEVVALYQASGVDAMGAVMMALGSLAYLPTLLVWALSWVAGPGFFVGAGATVSPAATHLGVVPGLAPLGLIPETNSVWFLAVILLPIAVGVLAGWMVRTRYVAVLGEREPIAPRLTLVGVIAAVPAGIAAVAFLLASGSLGPGRMAEFGPQILMSTLALFVEVAVGAAVMLLAPRGQHDEQAFDDDSDDSDGDRDVFEADADSSDSPTDDDVVPSEAETAVIEP